MIYSLRLIFSQKIYFFTTTLTLHNYVSYFSNLKKIKNFCEFCFSIKLSGHIPTLK